MNWIQHNLNFQYQTYDEISFSLTFGDISSPWQQQTTLTIYFFSPFVFYLNLLFLCLQKNHNHFFFFILYFTPFCLLFAACFGLFLFSFGLFFSSTKSLTIYTGCFYFHTVWLCSLAKEKSCWIHRNFTEKMFCFFIFFILGTFSYSDLFFKLYFQNRMIGKINFFLKFNQEYKQINQAWSFIDKCLLKIYEQLWPTLNAVLNHITMKCYYKVEKAFLH